MLFELNRYPRSVFIHESGELLRLAVPILIAQAASVGTGVVDTVMAGHAGAEDLAAVALGSNVFITLYVMFMGVMTALNPILAQLYGANQIRAIGEYGRQGLWFGLFLGVFGMCALWLIIAPLQQYLNLGSYTDHTFGRFLFWVSLGFPAAMLHRTFYAYASSLNKPKLIMLVSLAALLLNIPLNYVFVYGKLGFPAMGGAGCGLATALCFWFNALALGIYVSRHDYFAQFGLFSRFELPQWVKQWQILKLGIPIGLSFFLEVSLFTFIGILVARFGVLPVAAQQVVINITSLIYMLPLSIGTALAVRVAQAVGMGKLRRARYVSGVGLSLGLIGTCITATLLLLLREQWLSLYTSDKAVIAIGMTLLLFSAVCQFSDGTQTIASYALRGYKLTKIPMFIHAITFWGFGLGLGSLLGLGFGWGLYGFWTALVISLLCAAIALVWYLHWQSNRLATRQGWCDDVTT
ncbi:MATE family efflux transporter [Stenoxybacter acetivorans]|uniref:MATE family efflux transporter n=1 Tax=Stenoxybacter acetivorans TaxID=422441 RepID=UPI0005645EC9|nr:MATE family efflux transporter [Stenoxybacter acetivorans]